MLKRIISILLSLTVIFSFGLTANAARGNNEISPNYLYTLSGSSSLDISNSTATCKSQLTGVSSKTTKVVGCQYLEKKNGKNWETVSGGTWSDSANGFMLTLSNTKKSLDSGTYRVRAVFTVYSGTKYETVEKTSNEVTV